MRVLRDIWSAFTLLTVLPLGSSSKSAPGISTVSWFPLVGFGLGGLVAGVLAALNVASSTWSDGAWLSRAALPLAVLVVTALALLTRMIHWDGLADVSDAWWGGETRERRLEIMGDSSVGAFGATTVVLAAVAQIAALAALLPSPVASSAVVAVPVFGRLSIVFAAWLGTPARPGGLGALVMGRPRFTAIATATFIAALTLGFVSMDQGLLGLVWSGFALLVAAAVPHLIALRMGGVTGDVMGASLVVTETVVLLALALVVTF